MEYKFIFIVIAIIFWVVKTLSKNSKNKKPTTAKPKQRKAASTNKSIDDIFNDFVKEIESKNKPKKQPVVAPVRTVTKKKAFKEDIDWQDVETTHIAKKKQLLDHEDYHGISHRIDPIHKNIDSIASIADSEGEIFQFDLKNIDLKQMIISKEILDPKYI